MRTNLQNGKQDIRQKQRNINDRYRNSERGYFMELMALYKVKQSKHGNEFKGLFDGFFNHWVEQQKNIRNYVVLI